MGGSLSSNSTTDLRKPLVPGAYLKQSAAGLQDPSLLGAITTDLGKPLVPGAYLKQSAAGLQDPRTLGAITDLRKPLVPGPGAPPTVPTEAGTGFGR